MAAKRVLITSSRSPHALCAVREFGRRGWEVTAADCTYLAAGGHSRYTARRLTWPNMTEQPGRWLETCLAELKRVKYDLLFPTFEETFLVSRFRDELARHTTVLVESYEKMMRVHHKLELTKLAQSLNLDLPETWQPTDANELERIKDELPYPVVLKLPDSNNSLGLAFCDDAESLVKTWHKRVKFFGLQGDRLPMIQRKVEGELIFSLFLADHGRTVGQLIYEPLLMFPDGGGTAFYRQSTRNHQAEKLSMELLEHLGWHGFLGFDYIIEPGSGRTLLIDANPRTNPALMTGQSAEVDFVGLAIELAEGKHPQPQLEPRPGVRSKIWFVHWLWFSFQLMPGRGWRARLRSALRHFWLKGFVPDIHRRDDRMPGVATALFVPWFMLVINALKGPRGGYMYGCNYDRQASEKLTLDAEQ
ncbi:MAG: hypothetical protein P9M14_04725 [Candidatus Alcyoniella australis]|nr:hypothetical protein [Candidatus Alcyoniella australis]